MLSRTADLQSSRVPAAGRWDDPAAFAAACECESPVVPVPFFVTHLNWRFHEGVVREAQVAAVAARSSARAHRRDAALLGLRLAAGVPEIRYLRGLVLAGTSTSWRTASGWWGRARRRRSIRGRTLRWHRARVPAADRLRLRAWTEADGSGAPLSARVVLKDPRDGVWASDHYGVLAERARGPGAPLREYLGTVRDLETSTCGSGLS